MRKVLEVREEVLKSGSRYRKVEKNFIAGLLFHFQTCINKKETEVIPSQDMTPSAMWHASIMMVCWGFTVMEEGRTLPSAITRFFIP